MAPGADEMVTPPPRPPPPPPPPAQKPHPPNWDSTDPKPLGGIHTIYAWVAVGPKWVHPPLLPWKTLHSLPTGTPRIPSRWAVFIPFMHG